MADLEEQRLAVRDGALRARRCAGQGIAQTRDTATMSLSVMGRMLTGEVSVKNLSGPVTMPTLPAVRSPGLGALHQVSGAHQHQPGVLNLLPVPCSMGALAVLCDPRSSRAARFPADYGDRSADWNGSAGGANGFAFYNDINRLVAS